MGLFVVMAVESHTLDRRTSMVSWANQRVRELSKRQCLDRNAGSALEQWVQAVSGKVKAEMKSHFGPIYILQADGI